MIGSLSTMTLLHLILKEVGKKYFIFKIKFLAKNQNITVGVSFGATRELAFLHATNGTKIYFPQVYTNNSLDSNYFFYYRQME